MRPGSMGTSPPNPQRVRALYRAVSRRKSSARDWADAMPQMPAYYVAKVFRISCAEVRRIVRGEP